MKIIMLFEKKYPTEHAVMNEVFAKQFPERGHEITWLMPSAEINPKIKIIEKNNFKVYVTSLKNKEKNVFQKIMNTFIDLKEKKRILKQILSKEKIDIIFVRNSVPDAKLALKFSKKYKIPFVFQRSFPTYEHMLLSAKTNKTRFPMLAYIAAKIGLPMSRKVLKKADLVLAISKWMKKDMVEKGMCEENKIYPFPLGATIKDIEKNKIQDITKKYGLKDNVIIYQGSLDKMREMSFLIETMKKVLLQIPDAQLLMVGKGNDEKNLKSLARELGIENNIIFTGFVSRERVLELTAASNIGVSPIVPKDIYLISSPTKIVEYLSVGTPVVGNDIPDQKEIIDECKCGKCVKYDIDDFSNGIISILKNKKDAEKMGVQGRKYILEKRGYSKLGTDLEKELFKLIKKS